MNIPNEMIVNSVEHRYAGNSFAVVETLKDDWARVVSIAKYEVGNQFFLVWIKLLKTEKQVEKTIDEKTGKEKWVKTERDQPILPKLLDKLNSIRQDLASGKKIIKDTRLVTV